MSTRPRHHSLSTCLPAGGVEAIRDLVARFGPFASYVSKPVSEGLGKGLTRRHDAALNFYRQRAAAGISESMEVTAARTNLLRGQLGEPGLPLFEGAEVLWNHPAFSEAAAAITGKGLVRPSNLYANVLLPGQELAIHSDTPAYRGMDQTTTSEWLLVVMAHSGLFESHRVRVGAAVSFFSTPVAGEFVLYGQGVDGPPTPVRPVTNTAVMLDTEELFHGVLRVGAPDAPPPPVRIGMDITWEPEQELWILRKGDTEVARYSWDEVRLSFQWKGHCFADEQEEALVASHADDLVQPEVEARLVDDLRERGLLGDTLPNPTKLALTMIDTYVRFPALA